MHTVRTVIVVALLAFTAGSLDGALFSLYDTAFASIMTGNMILLGVAAASLSLSLIVTLMFALVGYCAGVYTGARIVRGYGDLFHSKSWPLRIIMCLLLGLITLCGAAVVMAFGDSSTDLRPIKFMLFALSMGFMAASVRKIGYSISVTYLTGSITTFWERIATRAPLSEAGITSVVSVTGLIMGALGGGITSHWFGEMALIIPITSMLVAIIVLVINGALSGRVRDDRNN